VIGSIDVGELWEGPKMTHTIAVEKLNIGIRPGYEGVVVILNPDEPDQMLFALTPAAAIRVSEELRKYAQKVSEGSKRTSTPRDESHSTVIARERGERLDS
jgi:hypothetical protein